MIHLDGIGSFEIILILLTEVVAFYVRFTSIGFQGFSLKLLFLKFLLPSLGRLHKYLYKFYK